MYIGQSPHWEVRMFLITFYSAHTLLATVLSLSLSPSPSLSLLPLSLWGFKGSFSAAPFCPCPLYVAPPLPYFQITSIPHHWILHQFPPFRKTIKLNTSFSALFCFNSHHNLYSRFQDYQACLFFVFPLLLPTPIYSLLLFHCGS